MGTGRRRRAISWKRSCTISKCVSFARPRGPIALAAPDHDSAVLDLDVSDRAWHRPPEELVARRAHDDAEGPGTYGLLTQAEFRDDYAGSSLRRSGSALVERDVAPRADPHRAGELGRGEVGAKLRERRPLEQATELSLPPKRELALGEPDAEWLEAQVACLGEVAGRQGIDLAL